MNVSYQFKSNKITAYKEVIVLYYFKETNLILTSKAKSYNTE